MRPAVIVFAPLLLLPFLACTDTPVEPETEETASFKAEKPPKDYGDWLVVDVQCSGPKAGCSGDVYDYPDGLQHGYDCKRVFFQACEDHPPYIETPGVFRFHIMGFDENFFQVCGWAETLDISVLNSGPITRYCVGGDNIVVKATFTRVIND